MKTTALGLIGLFSPSTYAYVFSHFIVNGTEAPPWKYVRDVAAEYPESYPGEYKIWGQMRPIMDFSDEGLACGRQSDKSAGTTQTADVVAGSEVGFHIEYPKEAPGNDGWNHYIWREGPAQAYLAKAPNDDLENFKAATGKWFKIASITAAHGTTPNDNWWITYQKTSVNITIPANTPPGKYLLRIEHVATGNKEFFVNCAHVNIIGKGDGYIPDSYYAQFPGEYRSHDPLIDLDYGIWNQPGALLYYVGPGPRAWKGTEKPDGQWKRATEFVA